MNDELKILLAALHEAGQVILDIQKTGFSIEKKANNDIVTQADLQANHILKSKLLGEFPHYGWLSEESVDDEKRLACKRTWIVDPIDGTKEYASGIPEYAISVALVEQGRPILAAVFNPARDELFHAIHNEGAWLNDTPIRCTESSTQNDSLFLASRSEYKRGEWDRFQQLHKVQQVGSIAYKLALVAAGKAQVTFSLGPKNEWDIAAGVLLMMEAKGIVSNKYGQPLTFNQRRTLMDGVVATTSNMNAYIFSLIENNV